MWGAACAQRGRAWEVAEGPAGCVQASGQGSQEGGHGWCRLHGVSSGLWQGQGVHMRVSQRGNMELYKVPQEPQTEGVGADGDGEPAEPQRCPAQAASLPPGQSRELQGL